MNTDDPSLAKVIDIKTVLAYRKTLNQDKAVESSEQYLARKVRELNLIYQLAVDIIALQQDLLDHLTKEEVERQRLSLQAILDRLIELHKKIVQLT